MQATDKNIQDHLTGLATGNHRQRQHSITKELLDIGSSSRFELGALPGLDRPDLSALRSCAAPFLRSPLLLPNN
jgi:hypothetical protein